MRPTTPGPEDPAAFYDEVARRSAGLVLRSYSSSFGLASRLLAEPVRTHVRTLYALVRLADEVVDAPRAGLDVERQRTVLDELETETLRAMGTGHSANLVVHAFAGTARLCGIEPALVTPFFASMRTDLDVREHDRESFERYVYGSAEVVGLMCLRAFLLETPDPDAAYAELEPGARALGAAFQKVNFLRDLAEDSQLLGRRYFPGVDPAALDEPTKHRLLDDIDTDLRVSAAAVRALPASSRRAVAAAHALFAELSQQLRSTPAAEVRTRRVRVTGPRKAVVVARSLATSARPVTRPVTGKESR